MCVSFPQIAEKGQSQGLCEMADSYLYLPENEPWAVNPDVPQF